MFLSFSHKSLEYRPFTHTTAYVIILIALLEECGRLSLVYILFYSIFLLWYGDREIQPLVFYSHYGYSFHPYYEKEKKNWTIF